MPLSSSFHNIPILDARHAQRLPEPRWPSSDVSDYVFILGCYSKGLTPEFLEYGYRQGLYPWPNSENLKNNLYPWGRGLPCTVLSTASPHLTHSLKKRLREALADHYQGFDLEIKLDQHYDETLDTVAEFHRLHEGETWLSNTMRHCWKTLHQRNHAHVITVSIDHQLSGGIFFTTFGRMLYGETAFSWRDDASRLALLALCALAKQHQMPVIDCQMDSPFVNGFQPKTLQAQAFSSLNQSLVNQAAPHWPDIPKDLLTILKACYTNLCPRHRPELPLTSTQLDHSTHDMPETTLQSASKEYFLDPNPITLRVGKDDLSLPLFCGPCSYHPERQIRHGLVTLPQPDVNLKNTALYEYLIQFGFRRDADTLSRCLCQGCQQCLPTRIDILRFRPGKTMRRIFNHNRSLIATVKPLAPLTDEQWDLFQRYLSIRHPKSSMRNLTRSECDQLLFRSPVRSEILEIREPPQSDNPNKLLMVCIIDRLENSLSAVYNFYDPSDKKRSLGMFGVLVEILYAKQRGLAYLHLGHWLKDYPGMDYKRRYQPIAVFQHEQWIPLAEAD